MYEVVHMSRSDSFCFCQRLARIFELASYNKCHYAILNINIFEYWQSEEAHGRTEGLSRAWGVSFLRHPSSFFPLCVFFFFFHAVFRRREAADFPFNYFSCRSECQSNSSAATNEKKQGRGGAAAKSPLFWGIDGQESENNWVLLTVVRHWLLMLQFLTRQDAGGAAPMRAAL